MVLAKAAHFIAAASPIMNNIPRADPEAYNERDFRSIFGTTPQVCSILWNMLDPAEPDSPLVMGRPKYEHLLWLLHYVKEYRTEDASAKTCYTTSNTYRRRVNDFASGVYSLDSTSNMMELIEMDQSISDAINV